MKKKTTKKAAKKPVERKQNGDGFQRDGKGMFGKGNKGGGRKSKGLMEFRAAVERIESEFDADCIARALVVSALGGDMAAMRLLLEYKLGKPRQALEITGNLGVSSMTDAELEAIVRGGGE